MASKECDRLRPHLVDYVVGELDPSAAQQADIEKHLAACEECRAAAEELRGTGRALEAVRTFDTHLDDDVRKNITSRARVEAQLVRATRQHERVAGGGARRVPLAAWIVLVLGTVGALVLAAVIPRMGLFTAEPAGRVLACFGDRFKADWPADRELVPGEEVSVPKGALVCLKLNDHTRLDLCGPAEVRFAGEGRALSITKGKAYLEARSNLAVELAPLKKLRLAAGSRVCIKADPVAERAALVTVLAGSADYSANGGDGKVEVGETLEVNGRSAQAKVRTMEEAEKPHWRPPEAQTL